MVNQYREGKAKRTPVRGEIEPETVYITNGRSRLCPVTAYLCIMGQRLIFSGKVNRMGSQGNRVLTGRLVSGYRPETE